MVELTHQEIISRIKNIVSELRYHHRGEQGDAGMDWLYELAVKGVLADKNKFIQHDKMGSDNNK